MLEDYPDEQRQDYGQLIGLCNLTPVELWSYLQQTAGYRDSETGNTKRPKLINPSGSFRVFNSFINDPINGVKIVAHENRETEAVEYVLQYKKRKSTGKISENLTPGNNQPAAENQIVNESGLHANASTYQQTTKLLILNYTETPATQQGKQNLQAIRERLATRQSQAIQNGATIVDQKTGREITAPYFYLPTPEIKLPPETLIQFTLSTIVLHAQPQLNLNTKQTHRLKSIVLPESNEQRFIQLQTNSPPPRVFEPHTAAFYH